MSDKVYRDLGETPSETVAVGPAPKYYPTINLCIDDFPELADLEISDTVELTFRCKLKSRNESENYSDVYLELQQGVVSDISKDPVEKKTDALVEVKNEADVALSAIKSLTRKF